VGSSVYAVQAVVVQVRWCAGQAVENKVAGRSVKVNGSGPGVGRVAGGVQVVQNKATQRSGQVVPQVVVVRMQVAGRVQAVGRNR